MQRSSSESSFEAVQLASDPLRYPKVQSDEARGFGCICNNNAVVNSGCSGGFSLVKEIPRGLLEIISF